MRVKLKIAISGTRNGKEWPRYGEEIDLPEQEALDMIAAGNASAVATFRRSSKAVPARTEETRSPLVPTRTLKGGPR